MHVCFSKNTCIFLVVVGLSFPTFQIQIEALYYLFNWLNFSCGLRVLLKRMNIIFPLRLTMMMMMRREMRIRPEETGPIKWILFCPWLATRWDWGTCGGSLILPSKTVEVRFI